MKAKQIVYWVVTGLLSLFLAYAVFNYLTKFEMVEGALEKYGYAPHLIYVLIVSKTLAIIALLAPVKGVLKEWVYAGLFYNFVLAFLTHYVADDGEGGGAVIALVLLTISYFLGKQVRPWIIRD